MRNWIYQNNILFIYYLLFFSTEWIKWVKTTDTQSPGASHWSHSSCQQVVLCTVHLCFISISCGSLKVRQSYVIISPYISKLNIRLTCFMNEYFATFFMKPSFLYAGIPLSSIFTVFAHLCSSFTVVKYSVHDSIEHCRTLLYSVLDQYSFQELHLVTGVPRVPHKAHKHCRSWNMIYTEYLLLGFLMNFWILLVKYLYRVRGSPELNFQPMFEYLLDPAIQNDKYDMWMCINR